MPKKLAVVFLVVVIAFVSFLPAAATANGGEMVDHESMPESAGGNQQQQEGGFFSRVIATPINGLAYGIMALQDFTGGIETFSELVYNKDKNPENVPFNESERNLINTWYEKMFVTVLPFILILVLITAYKMIFSGFNPGMKGEAMESMMRWFMALVIMAGAPLFVDFCLQLNNGLVESFYTIGQEVNASENNLGHQMPSITGEEESGEGQSGASFLDNVNAGHIILTALVRLVFAFLALFLNILYLIRKMTLIVLIIFAPIMAIMWAINKQVMAVSIWVGEVLSNTFMQASHALVFTIWLTIVAPGSVYNNFFPFLIGLIVLIPLTEMIRNSMQGLFTRAAGMSEEKMGGLAAAGLGSVAGLAKVGSSMFKGDIKGGKGAGSSAGGSSGDGPGGGTPSIDLNGRDAGGGMQGRSGVIASAHGAASAPSTSSPASSGGSTVPSDAAGSSPAPTATAGTDSHVEQSSAPEGMQGAPRSLDRSEGMAGTQEPRRFSHDLDRASRHGRVAGTVAGTAGLAVGGVARLVLPGKAGETVQKGIGSASAAAGRMAGTTASAVGGGLANAYMNKKSFGESFKEIAGADKEGGKGKIQAVKNIATTTASNAVSPQAGKEFGERYSGNREKQKSASLDGHRWN